MSNLEKLSDNPKIFKGSFVTAELVDPIIHEGKEFHPIRQGVYLGDLDDGTIIIRGESQKLYRCFSDAHVVPDKNLCGSTTEKFVRKIRKSLV